MRSRWLALALSAFATDIAASQDTADGHLRIAPLADRVAAYAAPLVEAGELWGTLVVARGDSVLLESSWGFADRADNVANTPETPFPVASLSKPLTAMIAASLVDAGVLARDDTIARWLPDFPRGERITIEHLLRHRSGIPHRVTTDEDEIQPQTTRSMVRLAAAARPLDEPGAQSIYSSAGYSVLARILELASGRSYAQLLDSIVLAPAGARHSRDASTGRPPCAARAYLTGVDSLLPAPVHDLSFLVGAGSLYSTPRDLHRVMQRLLAGGYGRTARDALVGERGLRWNGITDGFRAFADFHPQDSLFVIFAGNRFTGATDQIRRDVPRLVQGESAEAQPPEFTAVALDEAAQERIEGVYRLGGSTQPLEFVSPSLARFGTWMLIATGADTLFSPQDYTEVTVARDAAGRAEALQWGAEGPRFPREGPLQP